MIVNLLPLEGGGFRWGWNINNNPILAFPLKGGRKLMM